MCEKLKNKKNIQGMMHSGKGEKYINKGIKLYEI